jgi:hypothetical protein
VAVIDIPKSGVTRLPRAAPACDPRRVTPGLLDQLNDCALYRNGTGAGNLTIDVLMRPGQDTDPDDDAALLHQIQPQLVSRLTGLPVQMCAEGDYPRPYLDLHVSPEDHGSWLGSFGQMLVMAYAFGATRENLPPPHGVCVPFYRDLGRKQMAALREAVERYMANKPRIEADLEAHKPPPPPPPPPLPPTPDAVQQAVEKVMAREVEVLLGAGATPDMVVRHLLA